MNLPHAIGLLLDNCLIKPSSFASSTQKLFFLNLRARSVNMVNLRDRSGKIVLTLERRPEDIAGNKAKRRISKRVFQEMFVFRKLCFLETPVLRFALLFYYRRHVVYKRDKKRNKNCVRMAKWKAAQYKLFPVGSEKCLVGADNV